MSTDKFEHVDLESENATNKKSGNKASPLNEMRITAQGRVGPLLRRAIALLEGSSKNNSDEKAEKSEITETFDCIVLKGMGRAISNTVIVAEVIKRRIKNLHQKTECYTSEIEDTYKAKEEGLKDVVVKRNIAAITIILSKLTLDETDKGYQAPLTEAEEEERQNALNEARKEASSNAARRRQQRSYRGRGRRGRGSRGGLKKEEKLDKPNIANEFENAEKPDETGSSPRISRGRGSYRGRGRYFRGRGRGRFRGRYRGRGY